MQFSTSHSIKISVSDDAENELQEVLYDELRRIALQCTKKDEKILVESINASFGSILRNDTTVVSIHENRKKTGYMIEAETRYIPSTWFWIFFILDIFLTVTIIGFLIGMGLTLGLYFYNKNLVASSLMQALQNVENKLQ